MFFDGPARSLALVLSLLTVSSIRAQQTAIDEAAAAYQQGKAAEAEQKLDTVLRQHPDELGALLLMGAVLDSEQRYKDAETYYQRALKIAPDSPQLLNNAANHFLASGNQARARELYSKVITIDPHHVNAALQLAQMSVDEKQGRRALECSFCVHALWR